MRLATQIVPKNPDKGLRVLAVHREPTTEHCASKTVEAKRRLEDYVRQNGSGPITVEHLHCRGDKLDSGRILVQLQAVQLSDVDLVIAEDATRIHRTGRGQLQAVKYCLGHGVRLILLDDAFDSALVS